MGAREFFQSVREASRDAERCRSALEALERRALSVSGPALGGRVSGTKADAMAARVASLVDREAKLHARIESDYALLDEANRVLYGDTLRDGLASLVPPWWADVLSLYYCDGMTWAEVGAVLGYSERHVQNAKAAAFDVLDAHGFCSSVAGRGLAEGELVWDAPAGWVVPHPPCHPGGGLARSEFAGPI